MLVLSLALRNPDINFAGIIATSPIIKFPKDRHMSSFKIFGLKLIGGLLEVIFKRFFIIFNSLL